MSLLENEKLETEVFGFKISSYFDTLYQQMSARMKIALTELENKFKILNISNENNRNIVIL